MTTTMAKSEVQKAVYQLAGSEKGQNALRHLLAWLDDDGLSLDVKNQRAVFNLLAGAFGPYPGTTRDFMREAIDSESLCLEPSQHRPSCTCACD